MSRKTTPYIPKNLCEVRNKLIGMVLSSPKFVSNTSHLTGDNIESAFIALNEGLMHIKEQIGEDNYLKLRDMSDEMRALFDADPDEKTGDAARGRQIILEMDALLKQINHDRGIPHVPYSESND